jgi:hypothetical protein
MAMFLSIRFHMLLIDAVTTLDRALRLWLTRYIHISLEESERETVMYLLAK